MTGIEIFIIVLAVLFFIFVVLSIVLIKRIEKRRIKYLEEYYCSMDGPKRFRVSRLQKDLENNDIPKHKALEIAIKLEVKGWRKTIDFGCSED